MDANTFAACKRLAKTVIDHRKFSRNLHVLIENFHFNAEDTKWTFGEMHRIDVEKMWYNVLCAS